jgi:hypothetical protein
MPRPLLSLVVAAMLTASTSASAQKSIEAGKLPPVRLSAQQVGKLKGAGTTFNTKVVWHGAGRQSDRNTFVCFVTKGTTVLGQEVLGLWVGTFEADGEYHSAMTMTNYARKLAECHKHGIFPPVQVKQRFM